MSKTARNYRLAKWVAECMAKGAALFARGMLMKDVATRLGYSKRGFEMLRQSHSEIWDSALRAAMIEASKRVSTSAARQAARGQFTDGNAVQWLKEQDAGSEPTLRDLLADYLLTHDLSGDSPAYYSRIVSVLETWYGGPVPKDAFTVDLCNHFLLAKKGAGKSSYYRKSLRACLRALLNHAGITGKLRPVKFERPDPQVWTPEEVDRLIAAAPSKEWRLRISLAYFTGLNAVDLERIERKHIVDGVLRWRRTKTGKLVVVQVPPWLIDLMPKTGLVCPWKHTGEYMRRQFRAIVTLAGLQGSFKKLRKTSGTIVESLHPGCGHLHLGNTRQVFELHYLNPERGLIPLTPTGLTPAAMDAPIHVEPKAAKPPHVPKVRIASSRGNLQLRYFCPERRKEIRIRIDTEDRRKAEAMRRDLAERLALQIGGVA